MVLDRSLSPWWDSIGMIKVSYWFDRDRGGRWMAEGRWSLFRVRVHYGPPPRPPINCRCVIGDPGGDEICVSGRSIPAETKSLPLIVEETAFGPVSDTDSNRTKVWYPTGDHGRYIRSGVSASEMNAYLERCGSDERVPDDGKTYTVEMADSPRG